MNHFKRKQSSFSNICASSICTHTLNYPTLAHKTNSIFCVNSTNLFFFVFFLQITLLLPFWLIKLHYIVAVCWNSSLVSYCCFFYLLKFITYKFLPMKYDTRMRELHCLCYVKLCENLKAYALQNCQFCRWPRYFLESS